MSKTLILGMFWILASSATATAGAEDKSLDRAAVSLERFKSLVGQWEASWPDGRTASVSYRLTGNGSAVVEEFAVKGDPTMDMLTVFHLDGPELILTHYCADNNQPRMRATWPSADPGTIVFQFIDATNLESPGDGHMHRAVFQLIDENRMRQEWTYFKDGKEAFTEKLVYHRKH